MTIYDKIQFKIFAVPLSGSCEELNDFMCSHRIVEIDKQYSNNGENEGWHFCIGYIQDENHLPTGVGVTNDKKDRIDLKSTMNDETYRRFSHLREIRKRIANEEAIPAYSVFSNEELIAISKLPHITVEAIRGIGNINPIKISKYASRFIENTSPESDKN